MIEFKRRGILTAPFIDLSPVYYSQRVVDKPAEGQVVYP